MQRTVENWPPPCPVPARPTSWTTVMQWVTGVVVKRPRKWHTAHLVRHLLQLTFPWQTGEGTLKSQVGKSCKASKPLQSHIWSTLSLEATVGNRQDALHERVYWADIQQHQLYTLLGVDRVLRRHWVAEGGLCFTLAPRSSSDVASVTVFRVLRMFSLWQRWVVSNR